MSTSFYTNKKIRLTKLQVVEGGLPAAPKGSYGYGTIQAQGFSLPVDYFAEGYMLGRLQVGRIIGIDRTSRNGVEVSGIMHTSEIQEIVEKDLKVFEVKTKNSVYLLQVLE